MKKSNIPESKKLTSVNEVNSNTNWRETRILYEIKTILKKSLLTFLIFGTQTLFI